MRSAITHDGLLPVTADHLPRVSGTPSWERRRLFRRARVWQGIGIASALAYAAAVLIVGMSFGAAGFQSVHGKQVLAVHSDAAAAAGLRVGDQISAVGSERGGASARARVLASMSPGDPIVLTVVRGGQSITLPPYPAGSSSPLRSAAGLIAGLLLLAIALFADRGGRGGHPQAFLRSALSYTVLLTGMFSLEVVTQTLWLAIPWIVAATFAAPLTCHFMHRFPAGPSAIPTTRLALFYGPPAVLAMLVCANHSAFLTGSPIAGHADLQLLGGVLEALMAAVYLSWGSVSRMRRVRHRGADIDPIARRWLRYNSLFVALPFACGAVWAVVSPGSFIAGGFAVLVAITILFGSGTLVLAMTRVPFGELDRVWRRSSGYVLATGIAAALYLGAIGFLGSTVSSMSGGDFRVALAATLVAAVLFGPLRLGLQRVVDRRFARDRRRARKLLREASEAAVATLEIETLHDGAVRRVREALTASGAAIYVASPDGAWVRVSLSGRVHLGPEIAADREIAVGFDTALAGTAARDFGDGLLVVPLPVDDRSPAILVVRRDENRQYFDDEERDLLTTAAANLVVALRNARAHTSLHELTEALRVEIDVAEKRRLEIVRLKERVEEENRALIGELAARSGRAPVIGQGLRRTFELVQKVAHTDATALVRGETGSGKELIARAIHAASSRKGGPFIVVNCGAIAAGLAESTLFGHMRGAFTGAVRDAQGSFRAADGGTIFLDEVGELPLDLQPKLLRVLQEREVVPVGSEHPCAIDVRVIAATHRDLATEVDRGRFRQDLLYRLQVVEVDVPALRQRRGDIEALADHFLATISARTGKPIKRLAPEAAAALLDHDWPGNVRELEHTLEAAVVYSEGEVIRATDLPIFDEVFRKKGERAMSFAQPPTEGGAPKAGLRETLHGLEKTRLIEALKEHGGNKSRTAKALGMSRGSLLRRLKRYGI